MRAVRVGIRGVHMSWDHLLCAAAMILLGCACLGSFTAPGPKAKYADAHKHYRDVAVLVTIACALVALAMMIR